MPNNNKSEPEINPVPRTCKEIYIGMTGTEGKKEKQFIRSCSQRPVLAEI